MPRTKKDYDGRRSTLQLAHGLKERAYTLADLDERRVQALGEYIVEHNDGWQLRAKEKRVMDQLQARLSAADARIAQLRDDLKHRTMERDAWVKYGKKFMTKDVVAEVKEEVGKQYFQMNKNPDPFGKPIY